jgi:hypothetical protein
MPRVSPFLVVLLVAALPAPTAAQVRRCALPDGGTVYTDRRCVDIGAVERRMPVASPQVRGYRASCPRVLRDLAFEVGAAIESRDVNRLASLYHWTGMSTQQGYAVMRRLQAIVDRPLVDLQPIYPGSTGEDDLYSPEVLTRPPTGFRIEQVSKNGSTPVRAVFALRKHLGCWWISDGGAPRLRPARPARTTAAELTQPARPPAEASAPTRTD